MSSILRKILDIYSMFSLLFPNMNIKIMSIIEWTQFMMMKLEANQQI
jgi:hypothetical protein